MQIRTLFLLCMTAVVALATCLGGWTLYQQVVEYRLAGRVQLVVEIDALLFAASDRISRERPATGNALLAEDPPDSATHAGMAALRAQADDALRQVEQRIAARPFAGAAAQLAIVRQIGDDLTALRAAVDVALKLPKSRRDPALFNHYLTRANAMFERTSTAQDVGDIAAALHDGTTVELIALSRFAWTIRSAMTLRTAPLMTALDAGAKMDPEALAEQMRVDGIIEATWEPIGALAMRLSDIPGITHSVTTARVAFDAYQRLCQDIIRVGSDSAAYPLSALEFGRAATQTAPALLQLRDTALAAAQARVVQTRWAAGLAVIIAAVVLLLTSVVMAAVLVLLQRRIILPVLALTEVIGRIARLDFNVAIPGRTRTDEIGRMAVALDALRRGAMAGEENKAQIVHMARHDALTGLPNRLLMQERLDHAVAMSGRGQISAVLCLDLDRFKMINDTFGHQAGDMLLQAVAARLLACVREVDTVSRLGGDEFVAVLCDLDLPDRAAIAAQRIIRAMSEPFDLGGQMVCIGVSIGIALAPQDATAGTALLKCADTALYRAKLEEKGSWRFFRPEMNAQTQDRMAMERDLRAAVHDEAFALAYQPQYDVTSGRLCGFEALLRWPHPRRGMIGPAAFIPIAEETGLIVAIGAWVLRQACAEAMRWPDDLRLAVNLSGVQFKHRNLVRTVRTALDESGLPAHRLELEITESALLTNSIQTLGMLEEMHALGIHIAMDDFGTGYSSLSYLRSFPFDTIKIDQSFVRDLSERADSRAIVRAVVALARSLGMSTTAEGVETAEQLAELRREGCDTVQGYFFSRPIGPDEARLLATAQVGATA
jgi:diguanylate cyclase (GGDEF)-like protein